MLFTKDHARCTAASYRLAVALSQAKPLTYQQEDEIHYAQNELEYCMRSLATGWAWIGALSAGLFVLVVLLYGFHGTFFGDFGWLAELALMGAVIGAMVLSARITHDTAYARLRARYWPRPPL